MRNETWLEGLACELRARGVGPTDVAGVVVELQGHLDDSAQSALDSFGAPQAYAAQVSTAIGAAGERRPAEGPVRVSAHRVAKSYRQRSASSGPTTGRWRSTGPSATCPSGGAVALPRAPSPSSPPSPPRRSSLASAWPAGHHGSWSPAAWPACWRSAAPSPPASSSLWPSTATSTVWVPWPWTSRSRWWSPWHSGLRWEAWSGGKMEGALAIFFVAGLQATVSLYAAAAKLLPFWSPRELATVSVDGPETASMSAGLLHALLVIALCAGVVVAGSRLPPFSQSAAPRAT